MVDFASLSPAFMPVQAEKIANSNAPDALDKLERFHLSQKNLDRVDDGLCRGDFHIDNLAQGAVKDELIQEVQAKKVQLDARVEFYNTVNTAPLRRVKLKAAACGYTVLKKLFNDHSSLVLGEKNGSHEAIKFVIKNADALAFRKVDVIFVTSIPDEPYRKDLESFFAENNPVMPWRLENYLNSLDNSHPMQHFVNQPAKPLPGYRQLVETARKEGIKVLPLACLANCLQDCLQEVDSADATAASQHFKRQQAYILDALQEHKNRNPEAKCLILVDHCASDATAADTPRTMDAWRLARKLGCHSLAMGETDKASDSHPFPVTKPTFEFIPEESSDSDTEYESDMEIETTIIPKSSPTIKARYDGDNLILKNPEDFYISPVYAETINNAICAGLSSIDEINFGAAEATFLADYNTKRAALDEFAQAGSYVALRKGPGYTPKPTNNETEIISDYIASNRGFILSQNQNDPAKQLLIENMAVLAEQKVTNIYSNQFLLDIHQQDLDHYFSNPNSALSPRLEKYIQYIDSQQNGDASFRTLLAVARKHGIRLRALGYAANILSLPSQENTQWSKEIHEDAISWHACSLIRFYSPDFEQRYVALINNDKQNIPEDGRVLNRKASTLNRMTQDHIIRVLNSEDHINNALRDVDIGLVRTRIGI